MLLKDWAFCDLWLCSQRLAANGDANTSCAREGLGSKDLIVEIGARSTVGEAILLPLREMVVQSDATELRLLERTEKNCWKVFVP